MSNKINIQFAAKGHPGVIQAVKSLNKQVELLAQNNRILMGASGPLTAAQKKTANAFLDSQRAARNTGNTFSVLRSKMLLGSFAAGLFSATLLKLANMAGDANEQMAKASVVFGASTDSVINFANETSEATGRSRYSLIQMAASVQDILVPMGMLRHEAADLSKELVEAAIDVASFNNVTESDAMRDFNSALVGNHETVRKYGIVISEARMQQVALEQGIIQTGDTLTDQQKIMARLAIIQKDSSDAQGDAIRTADSYSNVMKALTAEFQEFGIEVGQQLMPVIKEFAKVMIFILENAFNPKFVRSLIFAMTALSISMLTTEKRMKSMSKTIKGLRASFAALSKSVGRFIKIMIAFEVAGAIFDKIFPGEEELKETSKGVEDITLELKAYNDELSRMTIAQIQVELDKKSLIKIKQEAAEAQEELDEDFPVNLDYPQLSTPIAPGFDATFIKLGTTEFQKLQEKISMLEIKLAEATGSNLDFSKSQLKVIKETEKLNKQLFVYGEETGTSVDKQRLANEAMAKYGININDKVLPAQEKLIEELEEYIQLEGELTAQNEISKIETKIAKLNGQSAAQTFLNQQRTKGIAISEADAQIITDLHDKYEARKDQLELAAAGQQLMNEIMQESQNQELAEIETKLLYLDALAEEIGLTNELAIAMDNLQNKKQEIEDLDGKTHKLSMFRNAAQRDGISLLMSNMSALAAQNKQGAKVAARLSQIEAFINTYEGVTEALSDKDYLGAATILVGGLAAVAQIENAMGQIGSYADGGYVGGSPHSQGGTIIEAERGEFVMSRAAVDSIGLETLNQMNQGGGSGTGTVIINVTGNVMEQDYVEGELAELIKEAVRRGSDFGMDDHRHLGLSGPTTKGIR